MAGGGGNDQLLNMGLMIAAGVAAPELAPLLMEGGAAGLGLGATAATGVAGAGLSAGVAGLTGQDVGRAAAMGALGGAASGYLGGVNPAEQGSMLAAGPTTPGAGLNTVPAGVTPSAVMPTNAAPNLNIAGNVQSTTPGTYNLGGAGSGSINPSVSASPINAAPTQAQLFGMPKADVIGGGIAGINSLLSTPPAGAYVPPNSTYKGGALQKFKYDPSTYNPDVVLPPNPVYRAQYAEGGIASLAMGGPMDRPTTNFANPSQSMMGTSQYSMATDPMSGNIAQRNMASGGIAQLAVGGKLLRGDGDGMSDSINANIAGSQQARLADGEFVIPADVVSHLGNGSTDAGAKHLYSMMDKVRQARVGTKKQGRQINPNKFIPV
jgi:hypothetical protein